MKHECPTCGYEHCYSMGVLVAEDEHKMKHTMVTYHCKKCNKKFTLRRD